MLSAPPADTLFSSFDLTRRPAAIAAVSGGSDSLAMLLLAKQWLDHHAPQVRLLAVTVDHGLRAESAAEAATVAAFAASRGVSHRTLRWQGDKPKTGLAEAARQARYRLLRQAAFEADSDVVITGHTADDQAETVLMRSRRGDGLGLAGMAPATLLAGDVWLLRPLLGVRRASLRAWLGENGVAWIDDPTNVDRRFERARVRAELDAEGDAGRWLEIAGAAASRRLSLAGRAAALVEACVRQVEPGVLFVAPAFLRATDGEAACHALRALLAVAGGTTFLPDAARTGQFLQRLAGSGFRGTLSRALVAARRDGLWLARETRGLPQPAVVGEGDIWDGRFAILGRAKDAFIVAGTEPDDRTPTPDPSPQGGREPGGDVSASPSPLWGGGRGGGAAPQKTALPSPPAAILRAARSAWPATPSPASDSAPAPLSAAKIQPILAPYHHMLPSFDLALARALAKVIGAAAIPAPPFAGHNGKEG